MLEVTGIAVGVLGYRRTRARVGLLRAALLAQLADLVTLALVWDNSMAAEHNPIAKAVLGVVLPSQEVLGRSLAAALAWIIVAALKAALIFYLDWAAPRLGRYRTPVLVVALVAGVVGAASNIFSFPILQGPGG